MRYLGQFIVPLLNKKGCINYLSMCVSKLLGITHCFLNTEKLRMITPVI